MLTANPFQETVQDAGLLSEVPWQCQIATPQLPIAGGNADLQRKNDESTNSTGRLTLLCWNDDTCPLKI